MGTSTPPLAQNLIPTASWSGSFSKPQYNFETLLPFRYDGLIKCGPLLNEGYDPNKAKHLIKLNEMRFKIPTIGFILGLMILILVWRVGGHLLAPEPSAKTQLPQTQRSRSGMSVRGSVHPVKDLKTLRHHLLSPTGGLISQRGLLHQQDVQKKLQLSQPLHSSFLQGIPRSSSYDAVKFSLVGKPETYVFGVQLWIEKSDAIRKRWSAQQRRYPNVRPLSQSQGNVSSFAAYRNGIHYHNLLHHQAILSLTCHKTYCPKGKHLATLAALLKSRLSSRTNRQRGNP